MVILFNPKTRPFSSLETHLAEEGVQSSSASTNASDQWQCPTRKKGATHFKLSTQKQFMFQPYIRHPQMVHLKFLCKFFYTKFPSHLKEIYCKGFRSLSMLSMTSKTSLCLYLNHLHDSGMSSWLSDNTSHQTWRCHKNYVNLIKLT